VLGCTHYPLLTGVLSLVMGEGVTLVSSAEETAKDVYRSLARGGLENPSTEDGEHHFMATGDAEDFGRLARRFLGPEVATVEHVDSVAEQYPTGVMARVTEEMLRRARIQQQGNAVTHAAPQDGGISHTQGTTDAQGSIVTR
jgi:glutamate racemase